MTQREKSRAYCFTKNFHDESFFTDIHPDLSESLTILGACSAETLADAENVEFAVFQFERGEEGTLHCQGFIRFAKPTRWQGVSKIVDWIDGAHFEKPRGTD